MEDQGLTSDKFGLKSSVQDQGAKAPRPVSKRKVKGIIHRFVLDHVPMGKSAVSFPVIQGGKIQKLPSGEVKRKMLPLNDKVAVLARTMSKVNYTVHRKVFLEMGFREDHRSIFDDETEDITPPNEDIPKYRYKYGHPDNSPTEKIQGVFSVNINGENIELELKDGFIKTDDDRIAEALDKLKFYLADKQLLEDSNPDENNDPDSDPDKNKGKGGILGLFNKGKNNKPEEDNSPELDADGNPIEEITADPDKNPEDEEIL